MKTEFRKLTEENLNDKDWAIDLSAFPNCQGINLCSIEGITTTRQDDGQLVSMTVHYIPSKAPDYIREYELNYKR
jgi:hypothetical protein